MPQAPASSPLSVVRCPLSVVRCNITPASHGCDRDGSPATPGCGWYVQIRHDHDILTRYCHMLRRPDVVIGQHVLAGQILGYVGSSGHSSGPHLHFEVHINNDTTHNGAIDPISFMATRATCARTLTPSQPCVRVRMRGRPAAGLPSCSRLRLAWAVGAAQQCDVVQAGRGVVPLQTRIPHDHP
ncbi:M23 family metallopeptidase [Dactylosporangium sp. NPDC049140]|uniref:M23 family metallopeptidase n=1 Tax=Dactylosporangium sp. NPDC049140 TaxID=3155647 RepID=UPI0034082A79